MGRWHSSRWGESLHECPLDKDEGPLGIETHPRRSWPLNDGDAGVSNLYIQPRVRSRDSSPGIKPTLLPVDYRFCILWPLPTASFTQHLCHLSFLFLGVAKLCLSQAWTCCDIGLEPSMLGSFQGSLLCFFHPPLEGSSWNQPGSTPPPPPYTLLPCNALLSP